MGSPGTIGAKHDLPFNQSPTFSGEKSEALSPVSSENSINTMGKKKLVHDNAAVNHAPKSNHVFQVVADAVNNLAVDLGGINFGERSSSGDELSTEDNKSEMSDDDQPLTDDERSIHNFEVSSSEDKWSIQDLKGSSSDDERSIHNFDVSSSEDEVSSSDDERSIHNFDVSSSGDEVSSSDDERSIHNFEQPLTDDERSASTGDDRTQTTDAGGSSTDSSWLPESQGGQLSGSEDQWSISTDEYEFPRPSLGTQL
ncbi:MAG: hypothetical protein V7776_22865 [Halopseudomonas aestusnigri]